MKHLIRTAPLFLVLLSIVGCQAVAPVGPSGSPTGTVTHVVVMWMNDPSDTTARHEVLEAGKKIEKMPGVISVAGGKMLFSDRPVVDTSFDAAFVITFRTEADMRNYLVNPEHVELKKNLLDRYVRKYQVYDVVAE